MDTLRRTDADVNIRNPPDSAHAPDFALIERERVA